MTARQKITVTAADPRVGLTCDELRELFARVQQWHPDPADAMPYPLRARITLGGKLKQVTVTVEIPT